MLANGKQDVRISANSNKFNKGKQVPHPEPPPLEQLNWLIHLQHTRGETESCKELIKNDIINTGGKNEYAFYKQGSILRDEGKIQEALESFQRCLKLNPDNADNLKEVAKCLFDMRRYRLSLEAYLEAENIVKNPDGEIYFNIGQCLLRLGDITRAKEYAHRAVKVGKHEAAYALLIKILITENDLRSAITVCNSAVESCPDSVSMLTESGLLFLKMGQTQHAFERLSSALALDHSCSKALLGIGYITQKHEEYDVALTKYKLAILHEPDSVALWNNIGMCFYSKQKYVAAISCLKRALWISPLNWKVLYNLGLVHLTAHQPASAFNFVCASVNLRPDVADSFIILGCALIELKDPENGLRALQQALLLAPDNASIIVNVAAASESAEIKIDLSELLQKFHNLIEAGAQVPQEISSLAEKLIATLKWKVSQREEEQNEMENSMVPPDVTASTPNGNGIESADHISSSDDLSPRELAPDEV